MRKMISPEDTFLAYMRQLRDELNIAYTHYQIAKSLREFRQTGHSGFHEARVFFELTQDSHLYYAILTICRFIDSRTDTIQLYRLFNLIRQNLELFTTSSYRERLAKQGKDEEDINYFAETHIEITAEIVDEDEARLNSLPVRNIIIWRHKKLAHLDEETALEGTDLFRNNPITVSEIDDIFTAFDEILNRYGIAYDGASWAIGFPGVDRQVEMLMDALAFYGKNSYGEGNQFGGSG